MLLSNVILYPFMLKITALPSRKDNYIWLLENGAAGRAAVVDPGEAPPVEAALIRKSLELTAILVTHHHYDHVDGIPKLVNNHRVPVFGPPNEPIPCLTRPVGEGEQLLLRGTGIELTVMEIPGHTRGHVGYYGHDRLFCGDTLFTGGCGKVFDGTVAQLFRSLQRISELPDETLIYCAHEYTEENLRFARLVEPENHAIQERLEKTRQLRAAGGATVPSTLAEERDTNPFLRCDQPEVTQAAECFADHPLENPEEVFKTLRSWRDRFN